MDRSDKSIIRAVYEAIKEGPTALGFDEERGVGVVAVLDYRDKTKTKMTPVAEIAMPIMPQVVTE